MKKFSFTFLFLLLAPLFVAAQIQWTDQMLATDDATIKEAFPDQAFPSEDMQYDCGTAPPRDYKPMHVSKEPGANQEAFIKMDISGLSPDQITVQLFCKGNADGDGGVNVDVYGVEETDWSEATITWNNTRSYTYTEEPIASSRCYNKGNNNAAAHDMLFKDSGFTDYVNQAIADGKQYIALNIRAREETPGVIGNIFSRDQGTVHWCSVPDGSIWGDVINGRPRLRTSQTSEKPIADARVLELNPTENFGDNNNLDMFYSAYGESRESYIKYKISHLPDYVSNAYLHMRGRQQSDNAATYLINAYSCDDNSWAEDSITWNNKPATGTEPLATVNVNSTQDNWWPFAGDKLTEHVNRAKARGDDYITIVMKSGSTTAWAEVWFGSKEYYRDTGIEFDFTPLTIAAPTISPNGGSFNDYQTVELSAEANTEIHYTLDGTEPTLESPEYTEPFELNADATLKARAFKKGYPGEIAEASFTITKVAPPSFSEITDMYASTIDVSIETTTSDANIYYTTDETDPDDTSTPYSAPVSISQTTVLKAIAYKSGLTESSVESATYTQADAPQFSTPGGTYTETQTVELTTTTTEGSILYTTDGTEPNANSDVYTDPITVDQDMTIKAKTVKGGLFASAVITEDYTFSNSIASVENQNSFAIYPNPANQLLNIELNSDFAGEFVIKIIDNTGKIVRQIHDSKNAGKLLKTINTSALDPGIYHLQIIQNATQSTRLIIER